MAARTADGIGVGMLLRFVRVHFYAIHSVSFRKTDK
jgi:hypothetical protein